MPAIKLSCSLVILASSDNALFCSFAMLNASSSSELSARTGASVDDSVWYTVWNSDSLPQNAISCMKLEL